ncbi:hypothetical protein LIER_39257 [Lithospermum erythrorhizon]|uniref:LOB domain-containing protein n=1 Tax=Lithospermum erythrorhizon TaxID=34254 RepID=A0AAV3QEM1_LITER
MLDDRPWTLARRPWVLQISTPKEKLDRRGVEFVPIWVRFPNLSLQFWNPEMLSKISSHIGTPKFADAATSGMMKLAYARLCIEVSAKEEPPDFVPLVNENGLEFRQKVVYVWKPPRCKFCKLFGHSSGNCRDKLQVHDEGALHPKSDGFVEVPRNRGKKLWRPKQNQGLRDEVKKITLVVESHVSSHPLVQGALMEVRNSFEALAEKVSSTKAVFTTKVNDLDQLASSSRVGEELPVEFLSQGNRRSESKTMLDKGRLRSATGSPTQEGRSPVLVEPPDMGAMPVVRTDAVVNKIVKALGPDLSGGNSKVKSLVLVYKSHVRQKGRGVFMWEGFVSEQHIFCEVEPLDSKIDKFFLSAIYGANDYVDRRSLWSSLVGVENIVRGSPWLIGGDFNVVKSCFDSWAWKQFLKHKEGVRKHVKVHIGNGMQTNFWHKMGVLHEVLSKDAKYKLRILEEAKDAEVINQRRWPIGRRLTLEIQEVGCVPRHSFCCWVLCHKKLPTRDRLLKWGVVTSSSCIFCEGNETIDHLFFGCAFSGAIRSKLLMYMDDFREPMVWDEEMQVAVSKYGGKSFRSRLYKLCLNCVVYEEVPEGQRADAANSLVYEANVRLRDPVYGCMGAISALQQEVQTLQAELNAVRAEILRYKYREAANNIIASPNAAALVSSVSVADQLPQAPTTPPTHHHHHHGAMLPPPPPPPPQRPQPSVVVVSSSSSPASSLYTQTSSTTSFNNISDNNIPFFLQSLDHLQ